MLSRFPRGLAAACALALGVPHAMHAQVSTSARVSDVAVNAAIGGVVAGVRSLLRGGSVLRPVALGALGGGVQGVGRQVAASRISGSGFVGRELSAVGISLAYWGATDSLLILAPVGPVMLEVRPGAAQSFRARVSLFDVATLARSLADHESSFDLESSFTSGVPTFRRPRARMPLGAQEGGFAQVSTIFLAREEPSGFRRVTVRHESVHVLQWDALSQLVVLPIERSLVSRVPGGAWLERYVDVGALAPLGVFLIARRIPYEHQPWEREAYQLTTGRSAPSQ
jgi:hypothetical protein